MKGKHDHALNEKAEEKDNDKEGKINPKLIL